MKINEVDICSNPQSNKETERRTTGANKGGQDTKFEEGVISDVETLWMTDIRGPPWG